MKFVYICNFQKRWQMFSTQKNTYVTFITRCTRSFLNTSKFASKWSTDTFLQTNGMLSFMVCGATVLPQCFYFHFKKIPSNEKHLSDIWQDRFNIGIHSQDNSSSGEIIIAKVLVESVASWAILRKLLLLIVYLILACYSSCVSAVSVSSLKHIVSRVWMNWIYLLEEKFCQLVFILQLGQNVLAFK